MSVNYFNCGSNSCQASFLQREGSLEGDVKTRGKKFIPEAQHQLAVVKNIKSDEVKPCVSVVGLNGNGLAIASRYLEKGHSVIAVDAMSSLIRDLLEGHLFSVAEPLRTSIEDARRSKRISATTDLLIATKCSDITVISNINHNQQESFQRQEVPIIKVLSCIAEGIKSIDRYHMVIVHGEFDMKMVKSTYIPLIERISLKKLGVGFGLSCVIEQMNHQQQLRNAYIKGFDKKGEFAIRAIYKSSALTSPCFDFASAV